MFIFDEMTYTAVLGDKSGQLQPLSFKMLQRLAQSEGQTVSVEELMDYVWDGVSVSPDSVKQRVFVLRKSLEDAGFEGVAIQAERGKGYRLFIDQADSPDISGENITPLQPAKKRWSLPFKPIMVVISVLILAVFSAVFFLWSVDTDRPSNNRLVLWTNLPVEKLPPQAASVYEAWRMRLIQRADTGAVQLVFSQRLEHLLPSTQARKERVALLGYFEFATKRGKQAVRLQIIEPKTATILKSNIIVLSDIDRLSYFVQQYPIAMEELILSGLLDLTDEQRNNSQDPIWAKLREIARQPDNSYIPPSQTSDN